MTGSPICPGSCLASERSLRRTPACPLQNWSSGPLSHSLGSFCPQRSLLQKSSSTGCAGLRFPPPTRPLSYAQAAALVPPALLKAEFVYVRRGGVLSPLAPLYSGPYRVLRSAKKFFVLDIGGRPETVSVDRLKPHLGMAQVIPAQPPPRGRPATAVPVSSTPS